MATFSTPSAKAHERVTGRWLRDIQVGNRKDWLVYYAKLIIGTPAPWLFMAVAILSSVSRAGSELAAWTCALLTCLYIVADHFARTREFNFFRIGGDFFLLGYVLVGLLSAVFSDTLYDGVATIGDMRWVLLLYAFTYCWELFPGLNRVFAVMMIVASGVAGYGLWQHFMGLDVLNDRVLAGAPAPGFAYFVPIGFFNTPEAFGTLLATLVPFAVAGFLLQDERQGWVKHYLPLALALFFFLAVFWTYRPGLWAAAGVGVVVTLLMQARQVGALLITLVVFFTVVMLSFYSGAPGTMLDEVQKNEVTRAEKQRTQINAQVTLWQSNSVVGAGHRAMDAANYDPGTGNVYFHVLAQSGLLGAACYLLFILAFLLMTYRIFQEIPSTHYWHRVFISGGLGAQVAFHAAGLYWSTLTEALTLNLFVLLLSTMSYINEHYSRGLVSDDTAL